MQVRTPEPVDAGLVHKSDPRNVLLGDLRLTVPSRLGANVLSEVAARDAEAGILLGQHYVSAGDSDGAVLRCLAPFVLMRRAELERRLLDAGLGADTPELLELYERGGEDDDVLTLRRDLGELECERLLAILGEPRVMLSWEAKLRISQALELLDDPPREYCAAMLVDTSHEFFFEHAIDHVPGLLVIEAARQMALATELRFRKMPAAAQFILSRFDSEFKGYVDLCLPADLYCRETHRDVSKPARLASDLRLEVVVRQLGRDTATCTIAGDIITGGLFERLRRNRAAVLGDRLFVPRTDVAPTIVLRGKAVNMVYGSLTALWLQGFRLRLSGVGPVGEPGDEYEFDLLVPTLDDIRGRARLVERRWEDGSLVAELAIVSLDGTARKNYQSAIAMHCTWAGAAPTGTVPIPVVREMASEGRTT